MYLVTADEMRAFDAAAIQDYGIPGVVLMENAGRTTFQILRDYLEGMIAGLKVAVVAGPGNNGGDGYVIARYLINHGADVDTYLLAARDRIKGDALINLEILEKMGARIAPVEDLEQLDTFSADWESADVIVDAILGTGLNSEVRAPYREAIEAINASDAVRLAVDLPSGLDADTGRILGCAVDADLTVTYGFRKIGMSLQPGADRCGLVEVADISIPLPAIEANPPKASLYDRAETNLYWDMREDDNAHKGDFGHTLVVGGSPGKTGAVTMAALAAGRMGAGLVTVAVPASLNPIVETKLTEEMSEPLPESIAGYLGEESADRILDLAESMDCIVLGPGMSTRDGIDRMMRRILTEYGGKILIDADGLNVLAGRLDWLKSTQAEVVLTPHPGEMARLTGSDSREVQADRVGMARKLATQFRVWVVLKGAGTITATPDGDVSINTTGNPWMASGGQGDVLSGILGSLMAQGMDQEEALPFGVYLHGLVADKIVEKVGPAPVQAMDVIDGLGAVLAELGR